MPTPLKAAAPPGPKGGYLFGSVAAFRRDQLGFYASCAREYGDVAQTRMGPYRILLIYHPAGAGGRCGRLPNPMIPGGSQQSLAMWAERSRTARSPAPCGASLHLSPPHRGRFSRPQREKKWKCWPQLSTPGSQLSQDAKPVTPQIEHAEAYASSIGNRPIASTFGGASFCGACECEPSVMPSLWLDVRATP
jgi:hypothetical protein